MATCGIEAGDEEIIMEVLNNEGVPEQIKEALMPALNNSRGGAKPGLFASAPANAPANLRANIPQCSFMDGIYTTVILAGLAGASAAGIYYLILKPNDLSMSDIYSYGPQPCTPEEQIPTMAQKWLGLSVQDCAAKQRLFDEYVHSMNLKISVGLTAVGITGFTSLWKLPGAFVMVCDWLRKNRTKKCPVKANAVSGSNSPISGGRRRSVRRRSTRQKSMRKQKKTRKH